MHFIDPFLKALNLLAKRLKHVIQAVFAGGGEGFALLFENLIGDIFKLARQGFFGLFQAGKLFAEMVLALFKRGFQLGIVMIKLARQTTLFFQLRFCSGQTLQELIRSPFQIANLLAHGADVDIPLMLFLARRVGFGFLLTQQFLGCHQLVLRQLMVLLQRGHFAGKCLLGEKPAKRAPQQGGNHSGNHRKRHVRASFIHLFCDYHTPGKRRCNIWFSPCLSPSPLWEEGRDEGNCHHHVSL